MTDIIEDPAWRYRPALCTCLPDGSGPCALHDFGGWNGGDGEAASAAITVFMEKLALDPENDDLRELAAKLLEPVLDVYLRHLADNARDPEGGDLELYTLADIRLILAETDHG